ncbi:MAG TPA: CaiB/BaiF CoA-transferase family protein [Dehalococcoidia bacterium]|nr:CaiB/BaiF CoA-transferase family protein [Dehalococcoidia bacterium]
MLALEHIRVLDLSRLAPGPYCSMLLADMGADVLMVEAPPQFVSTRPTASDPEERERQRAGNALRRNKRSLVLNLREDAGREAFYRLCADADVVLEGFRPGVVDRLGVDYETVSKLNDRIVYCSISGYGQTGPYRDLVGHDINYISVAGALGMIGRSGQPPAIPHNLLADFAGGGLTGAFAIAVALLAREQTGRGQYVDIAMSDGVMQLIGPLIGGVLAGAVPPGRGETRLSGGSPNYDAYETSDGRWISIGSVESYFWDALCDVVGRPDFKPFEYDSTKFDEIRAHFEMTFKQKTRDEWFEELREIDLCISPVLDLDEAANDEHNRARGMVVQVEDPVVGRVRQIGIAPKLSETPGAVRSTAPAIGAHSDDVLSGIGYSAQEIDALRQQNVVA